MVDFNKEQFTLVCPECDGNTDIDTGIVYKPDKTVTIKIPFIGRKVKVVCNNCGHMEERI